MKRYRTLSIFAIIAILTFGSLFDALHRARLRKMQAQTQRALSWSEQPCFVLDAQAVPQPDDAGHPYTDYKGSPLSWGVDCVVDGQRKAGWLM